jgi:hypothetical protein
MNKLGLFFLGLLWTAIVICILALPTMWSWDYFMPKFFHLPELTFCDALVLNVLSWCLFKGHSSTSGSAKSK